MKIAVININNIGLSKVDTECFVTVEQYSRKEAYKIYGYA